MSMGLMLLTFLHVLLSVAGIASGAMVAVGFLCGRRWELFTTFFLATTLATSLTGFLFPVDRWMPSHIVGIVSIVVLAFAFFTRGGTSTGRRRAFAVCALIALYLNVFVLIAQAFMKIPPLHQLAPTQTEPPFAITQTAVLITFIGLSFASLRRVGRRLPPVPDHSESADAHAR